MQVKTEKNFTESIVYFFPRPSGEVVFRITPHENAVTLNMTGEDILNDL